MSFTPIDFSIVSDPVPNTAAVTVVVSAATSILRPANDVAVLGEISIDPANLGIVSEISEVTEIVSHDGVTETHVEGSTLFVSFEQGLQISGTTAPEFQPFTAHAVAYPTGTPLATVLDGVRTSATPVGSAAVGPILSTASSSMTITGLATGTAYDVYLVVYDAVNDFIDYDLRTVTTTVDVAFSSFAISGLGITLATATVAAVDPDSANLVRIALVDPSASLAAYGPVLAAGLAPEPYAEFALAPSASPSASPVPLSAAFSNLARATRFKAVVSAVDAGTSNVSFAESPAFRTFGRWTVDEILFRSIGYSNVAAQVDVFGEYGDAFVYVATLPDADSAEAAWRASPAPADALSNSQVFALSSPDPISLSYATFGLVDDTPHRLAVKVVSANEPWVYTDLVQPFATVDLPSGDIVITDPAFLGGTRYFFAAEAAVDVTANYPVNVYTAIVPASVPDDAAFSNLLLFGSAAYPDAFVDQNQASPFAGKAERDDLDPGGVYKAVAVATFPFDLTYRLGASLEIGTVPLPTLVITKNFVTDTAIEVGIDASAGIAFNTYLYITSDLIAGAPQYDANLIADNAVPGVQLFLGQSSYDIAASFSNLQEDAWYGVVAVASDNSNVLVVREFVAKTGANPVVGIQIVDIGPEAVDYRVTVDDGDSSFELYTIIASSPFAQADAELLAADGLAYSGGAGVPGTATELPNDLLLTSVNIPYTASNLAQDTDYVIVAAAKDVATNVVRFQQIPFVTDFAPIVAVSSVSSSTQAVAFDLAIADRDGPSVTLYWKPYASPIGLAPDLVIADSGVSSLVNVGAGARSVTGLAYAGLAPGTTYYLAVVISTSAGNRALTTREFATFSAPTIAIRATTVYSETILVDVVASDPDAEPFNGYLALFDSNVRAADVDAGLAGAVAAAAAPYLDRVAFIGATEVDAVHGFAALAPGAEYTIVAVAQDILSGDLVFTSVSETTRVQPEITATPAAVTREGFVADLVASFPDPVPARANRFDYAATVVPRGAPTAWLAPGATHEFDVGIPILEGSNVDALALAYDAAGALTEITAYDFVLVATDYLDDARVSVITTPFTTRSRIAVSFSETLVSPSNAVFAYSAAVLDGGTAEIRAQVFPNPPPNASTAPNQTYFDLAVAAGDIVSAGATFDTGTIAFDHLAPNLPHLAVFVAVDQASGESNVAFETFATTSTPPVVQVAPGTVMLTSTAVTATVRALDADSPFTVFSAPLAAGTPLDDAALSNVVANASNVKVFHAPSPGFAPFSVTFTGLEAESSYRFVAVAQDPFQNRVFDFYDFTTLAVSNFLDRAEYDGAYTLAWRHDAAYAKAVTGVTLSNGKLAFVTAAPSAAGRAADGVAGVVIGGAFDFDEFGGYTNTLVDGFNAFHTTPFRISLDTARPAYSMSRQSLNMATGIVTSAGTVVDALTGDAVDIETDAYALRQTAFSAVMTVRFTATSATGDLAWFHEISGAAAMTDPTYNSVVVNSAHLGGPLSIFEAASRVRGSERKVACAVVYLFETPLAVTHEGFNRFRNSDRAFNRFTFSGLAPGTVYRVHILVTQATSADFPNVADAVRRLAISLRGGDAAAAAAARIRAAHVSAMARAWETAISVEPRVEATAGDQIEQIELQRAIRFAQYTLMGSVRDGSLTDLNPGVASTVDKDGTLLWGSEMYVIPYLLYNQSRTVRKLLETSFRNLEKAKALADGSGLAGALYPHVNPNLDYAAQPFWDVTDAQYVFKTALVGIAAWDYFRVTLDRAWLIQKGYAILAGVADMVVSKATTVGASGSGSGSGSAPGTVAMRSVLDANGRAVDNDALTLYTSRVALKAAIEASYELGYLVPEAWKTVFFGIAAPHFAGANFEIIKPNDAAVITDSVDILHPLVMLQEHFSADYLKTLSLATNNERTLNANALFYGSAAGPGYTLNPQNLLLLAGVHGVLARSTPAHADAFQTYLRSFLAEAQNDIWGGFSDKFSSSPLANSPALCAQFLTNIMTNLCGLHVAGGTTESGFRYEHYGVVGRFSTNLPNATNKITVPSIGRGNQTFSITNERLYVVNTP
eukprot:jgi/Tetstr1/447332/TSEL_034769.t1